MVDPVPAGPQTATKTWAPQIVGATVAAAYIFGKPYLRLNYADASAISDILVPLLAVGLPQITYWTRNYLKTHQPAWNKWLKGGAFVALGALALVVAWRFL